MLPIWATWLILCGIFLLIEIFTVTFLMFWPGIGAFLAFITSLLGFDMPIQIAVFVISTTLMIIFMKPLVKRFFKTRSVTMNSNSIIGRSGVVTKEIDNVESRGQVKVSGELWSAITEDGNKIKEGTKVEIESIEGVKLKVKKV